MRNQAISRRTALAAIAAAAGAPGLPMAAVSPRLAFFQGRYLPLWKDLTDAADPKRLGSLTQYAAFLGEEATALQIAHKMRDPKEGLPEGPLTARAALPRIVEAARGRRVVILNEAHVCSRHRAFLGEVLAALRAEGFTHWGAEDFLNTLKAKAPDVRAFTPGGPIDPDTGYYGHDPVYAEAIREGVALGYRLAPYEQRDEQHDPAKTDNLDLIAEREQAECDNLQAFLQAQPEARILVYVGYSHLREGLDLRGSEWMASRLKRATGLDPLTITQSSTGSFGPHAPDNLLTQQVLACFAPNTSIIVETADGVSVGAEVDAADLAVFHPPWPDRWGRPGWLARAPNRRRVRMALPRLPDLALVQAIPAVEPAHCVPADQYLVPKGAAEANFLLRPGRYRLRVETLSGFLPLGEVTV